MSSEEQQSNRATEPDNGTRDTGHGQRPVTLIMITFTLYRKEKKERIKLEPEKYIYIEIS